MPSSPPVIVQRDDGLFALGIADDAAGPFESRQFALAVAAQAKWHPLRTRIDLR
jgi:hypothetical protein